MLAVGLIIRTVCLRVSTCGCVCMYVRMCACVSKGCTLVSWKPTEALSACTYQQKLSVPTTLTCKTDGPTHFCVPPNPPTERTGKWLHISHVAGKDIFLGCRKWVCTLRGATKTTAQDCLYARWTDSPFRVPNIKTYILDELSSGVQI